MKKGNLRTVKKYGKNKTSYAVEVRMFGGTWRQLNQGAVVLVFDTEPEAIKKLLDFFEPNPLCLRADNKDK
jgi:uncharacterized protein YheU (UPF0270 family)